MVNERYVPPNSPPDLADQLQKLQFSKKTCYADDTTMIMILRQGAKQTHETK